MGLGETLRAQICSRPEVADDLICGSEDNEIMANLVVVEIQVCSLYHFSAVPHNTSKYKTCCNFHRLVRVSMTLFGRNWMDRFEKLEWT